ncbi:unnamed protein product, partial [Bubo scandiacus]
ESDRAALVGTWHPARVNPPQYVIKNLLANLSKLTALMISSRVPNTLCISKEIITGC